MDSKIRAICYERYVNKHHQQPSDVDLEAEAAKYLKEQADLPALIELGTLPAAVPLEPSSEDVSEDTVDDTVAETDHDVYTEDS